MGVYKEIAKADGSGITTFYRLSEENSTVETTSTGTTKTMFDYNDVLNKPSINDVALVGNKTLEDLGIQPAGDYLTEIPAEYVTEDELEAKDYATESFVIDQINNTEHFHREIVDALPLTGKDNVLYLVPKKGSDKDIYNEYIWTGVDYEFIGTTSTDLSDYYKKGEVDTLLDNKVTKVNGKQLSTNDYTTAEKTKLASLENYDDSELRSKVDNLHNYDDTEVKQEINQLKTAEEDIYEILDNAGESIDKKVEGIRLVKSGDSWTFYDIKGNIISFQLAKTSLGLPNTILFLEDIENDGKMTPVHYDIDEDTIHIYYTNYEGEYRYAKLQSSSVDDSILGTANHYTGIVDALPTSANKGDIVKLSTDKTIYLYDGAEWSAFDKASEVDLSNYLAKDNTVAYKPATDYNPSTKKYVDDSIADIFIPTKVSQLTNDSGFVLKTTNDLTNYYNKSNTYNKAEVNALVAGGSSGESGSTIIYKNIKSLGAVGDGIADDTQVIQQALDNYIGIYIPRGTYKLTASLIVRENNYIKCDDNAVMVSNHNSPFIINGSSEDTDIVGYNGNSNITIDGGVWDNNIENFTEQKSGFAFGHAKNITVKNLTILNTIKGHSIEIAGIDNMVIDNCKFLGCVPSSDVIYWECIQIEMCTSDGFSYFGSGDYTKPKNITVKNCIFSKTNASSYFHTAIGNHYSRHDQYFKNIVIENNVIEGCDYAGIRCYLFDNARIMNNTFTSCKRGVMLSGSNGEDTNSYTIDGIQTNIPQSCRNILIENNTFEGSTTVDVWSVNYKKDDVISFVDNIKVINNISNNSLGSFVYITYGNNIIINNNIIDNIKARAIDLSDCSWCTLQYNFVNQNKNNTQCILLRSADTNNILCTNANISNNKIEGLYTEGINIRGVNTFDICNNNILNAISNPIYLNNFCTNGNLSKNKIDNDSAVDKEYIKIFGTLNNNILLRDNIHNNYKEIELPFSITNTNKIYNDDLMSAWEILPLAEGITALEANRPMVIKNNRIINIRGGLSNVTSNDQIIATLPSNMIPSTGRYFVIPTTYTELEFVRVEIDNSGNIKIKQSSEIKADTIYRLDGIFFVLD